MRGAQVTQHLPSPSRSEPEEQVAAHAAVQCQRSVAASRSPIRRLPHKTCKAKQLAACCRRYRGMARPIGQATARGAGAKHKARRRKKTKQAHTQYGRKQSAKTKSKQGTTLANKAAVVLQKIPQREAGERTRQNGKGQKTAQIVMQAALALLISP